MGSMGKHHRALSVDLQTRPQSVAVPRVTSGRCRAFSSLLLLSLGISACATNPVGLQGRWTGMVQPVSGTCDPASQAVLIIEGGRTPPFATIFTPTGGVLALHGNSDGVSQAAADLQVTSMNHQPYALAFNGTRDGDLIRGSYITPRCRSNVVLQRK